MKVVCDVYAFSIPRYASMPFSVGFSLFLCRATPN